MPIVPQPIGPRDSRANAALALLRHVSSSPTDELALARGRSAMRVRKRRCRKGTCQEHASGRIGLPNRTASAVVSDVGRGKRL